MIRSENLSPLPRRGPALALLAGLLFASSTALAGGTSVDIELLRPTWSPGSIPGMDSPDIQEKNAVRAGAVIQYQRDPLILYRYGEEDGAVVRNRFATQLGASWDVTKWLSTRLMLPLTIQTDSQVEDYKADGFGLSDANLGVRLALPSGGVFHPGLHLDFGLPTGTRDAYMGEGFRGTAGILGKLDFGWIAGLVDVGFTGRKPQDTGSDFVLGSEIVANAGVMLDIWPERVALGSALFTRLGAENLGKGGAESSAEIFSDLQIRLARPLQLDVGFGRGLVDGYGSTEFRTIAALTYIRVPAPPEPPPEPPVVITREPPPPPEPEIEEPSVRPWEEGELARVEGLKIEIRDQILFEFGTNVIRPVSIPTLKSVADILQKYGQIDHMVIEGHASEEGSFEYNYNLSTIRAQAIFKQLMEFGVHANRMSYRGMGEVVPLESGTSEEALAANRRVEFHIIKLLDPLSPIPEYPSTITIPWTGESVTAPQPGSGDMNAPPPPKRAQGDDNQIDNNFFQRSNDDDDDWPMPAPTGGKRSTGGSDDEEGEQ